MTLLIYLWLALRPPAYHHNPMGVTAAEVVRARQALCHAARRDRRDADDLTIAALNEYGNEAAMGMALEGYLRGDWDEDDCQPWHWTRINPGRIGVLLRQPQSEAS